MHDLNVYLQMLRRGSKRVRVGLSDTPPTIDGGALIFGRHSLTGSLIGGIASDIEKIRIRDINEACERMLKSDVKYRFVNDMASLLETA